MPNYTIYFSNPATQYIQIEIVFNALSDDFTLVKLSKWRPGRYELGNFAKNVKGFTVTDVATSQMLASKKIDNDTWEIHTKNIESINVSYQYFANELNAGASYLNHLQLYVNPINCLAYIPNKIEEICALKIAVPSHYKIAIGLEQIDPQTYVADNFHELADAPFIASPYLKTFSVDIKGYQFYFDFMGECVVDEAKIKQDFTPFIERQLTFFGDMPTPYYRFLFQILPIRFYHGVEHRTSTVIALGPGYNLYNGNTYLDLLGVSCHELFHVWNVKSIRPKEMLPYDYTKENYARTGFVYEGITTYYGDLLLFQSKVYSQATYFETLEERINKHFHNDGRFNLSVADASFETWLDGYVAGTPGRKTSIYDEGNLVAFILDVFILEKSNNAYSLENVMHTLYQQYFKKGLGYDYQTIIDLVNQYASSNSQAIFDAIVTGKQNYLPYLQHAFAYLGLSLQINPSEQLYERYLGIKLIETPTESRIAALAENALGLNEGLAINDQIIGINQLAVNGDASQWLNYFIAKDYDLSLVLKNGGNTKQIQLVSIKNGFTNHYNRHKIIVLSDKINQNFKIWAKL
jgi:predicted metalloprotease with PDZ domain